MYADGVIALLRLGVGEFLLQLLLKDPGSCLIDLSEQPVQSPLLAGFGTCLALESGLGPAFILTAACAIVCTLADVGNHALNIGVDRIFEIVVYLANILPQNFLLLLLCA